MKWSALSKLGIFILLLFLVFSSGCGRTGLYSIVVRNQDAQHVQNEFNDLEGIYHDKDVFFPTFVSKKSDMARAQWDQYVDGLNPYEFNASREINLLANPGSMIVEASACGSDPIAVVHHDMSEVKNNGKEIQANLKYVCMNDNVIKIAAATNIYEVNLTNKCNEGIHSVEYQFFNPRLVKNMDLPKLKRVLIVCAKN